jgi:hypothetical protein
MDVNNDGSLDLEEFKKAVRFPSTVQQLVMALPISQIFADAMPDEMGIDRLRQFGQLTPKQIEDICLESIPYVQSVIQDAVKNIRVSFEAMDSSEASKGTSKFEVPPEMSAGTVGDFHGGLAERIGAWSTCHLRLCFFALSCTSQIISPNCHDQLPALDLWTGCLPRRPCYRGLVENHRIRALSSYRL